MDHVIPRTDLLGAVFAVTSRQWDADTLANDDHFHLVQKFVDCLPHPGSSGAYLQQMTRDTLINHKHYIEQHGHDLPKIQNWKWAS